MTGEGEDGPARVHLGLVCLTTRECPARIAYRRVQLARATPESPWVVGRPGTSVNCNPQDPKTLLSADFGAGPVGISSGSLTFPAVGLSYKVRALGSRVVVRVALWGDTAARLGSVAVRLRCADTAP